VGKAGVDLLVVGDEVGVDAGAGCAGEVLLKLVEEGVPACGEPGGEIRSDSGVGEDEGRFAGGVVQDRELYDGVAPGVAEALSGS
jgi:hypothetical protein